MANIQKIMQNYFCQMSTKSCFLPPISYLWKFLGDTFFWPYKLHFFGHFPTLRPIVKFSYLLAWSVLTGEVQLEFVVKKEMAPNWCISALTWQVSSPAGSFILKNFKESTTKKARQRKKKKNSSNCFGSVRARRPGTICKQSLNISHISQVCTRENFQGKVL